MSRALLSIQHGGIAAFPLRRTKLAEERRVRLFHHLNLRTILWLNSLEHNLVSGMFVRWWVDVVVEIDSSAIDRQSSLTLEW